jgi:hypothetical protein
MNNHTATQPDPSSLPKVAALEELPSEELRSIIAQITCDPSWVLRRLESAIHDTASRELFARWCADAEGQYRDMTDEELGAILDDIYSMGEHWMQDEKNAERAVMIERELANRRSAKPLVRRHDDYPEIPGYGEEA